jgi:HipA-like C-terminal domain
MIARQDSLQALIMAAVAERGLASSLELQQLSGKSQPTVSRALHALAPQLVQLGQGKRTRYGHPALIRGLPAQQALWWTDAAGHLRRWGTLTSLSGGRVHVQAEGIDEVTRDHLPWYLSPLKAQGFLGRAWGKAMGWGSDPDHWNLEQVLYAALRVDDAPGAISLGETQGELIPELPLDPLLRGAQYDALAADVHQTLPAGSSAGGEQAKFLTRLASGEHVLVKFTPPRGTPFGERWHDLLHAEALALQVLSAHGHRVATARVLETKARTYLESIRFDRLGAFGRRHAVALDAVHAAFVPGSRQHWAATCDALVLQRRLSESDAAMARTWWAFGRLINNTDMHFGNLSVWADDPAKAVFSLAPLYDMLPMRWRPDSYTGLGDYTPFELGSFGHGSAADLARQFWSRLAIHAPVSEPLRRVAHTMAGRF